MATKTFKGFRLIVVDNLAQATDMDKIYFVRTNSGGTNIGESTYKDEGYLFFNGKKYGNVTPLETRLNNYIGTIPQSANVRTVIDYINKVVADKNVSAHGDGSYISASASNNEVGVSAITENLGNAMTWDTSTSALTVGTATSATGLATAADVDAKRIADETAIISAFNSLKSGIDGLDATVSGETDLVKVEVVQQNGKLSSVTVTDQAKLTAAVAAAETAVQGVSGDSYVTATKTGTGVTLSAKTIAINSAAADTDGLATAFAVKNAINGSKISDVEYDSEHKLIYLVDTGGTKVGDGIDATAFIKDGMLSNAELVVNPEGQTPGTYIKLTWNTDAQKEDMYINVSSLIDTYTVSGDSTNYLAIDGYKIGAKTGKLSGATATAGLADATEAKAYVDAEVAKAKGAVNALNTALTATDNHVTVNFKQDSGLVNTLVVSAITAATADATAQADGLATAKDVKDYVDGQITALTDSLDANVSGHGTYVHITVSEENGKLTAATVVDSALTETVEKAASAVQSVNTKTGSAITLDARDVEMGADLTGNASAATASSAVSAVLQDIYDRLAASSAKLSIASADNSITVTTGATGTDIIVNREAKTDSTVADGHIAIEKNNNDALYGQMYYDGDDVQNS